MSWRIAVTHRTGYHYATPVRSSYNEVRMTPASGGGQQTLTARVDVSPGARPLRYTDYWGTVVHAFDVHVPHEDLVVTATSVVETPAAPSVHTDAGWDAVTDPAVVDRSVEWTLPSRYVVLEEEVRDVGLSLASGGDPLDAGRGAAGWAHGALTYARGATHVHSTSAEARRVGQGVCQDYAHLTLAVLRAMGVPGRYVSGYLFSREDAEVGETTSGESHAWVEFWAGRWVAVDPTSLLDVAERHVVVARGRDYADVRPLAGIYRGPTAEALGVSVELTRLR